MKTVAGIVIFLILITVLVVTIKDDMEKHGGLLEYRVIGRHTDGAGEVVYTIEVRDTHAKKSVFFGNIPASQFHTQPLSNNRWNAVPERDYPLYRRQ